MQVPADAFLNRSSGSSAEGLWSMPNSVDSDCIDPRGSPFTFTRWLAGKGRKETKNPAVAGFEKLDAESIRAWCLSGTATQPGG